MIPVILDADMIRTAKLLAGQQGILKNSFMEGKGNFVGYLGEGMFLKAVGGMKVHDIDHDIQFNTYKIEVKTKNTTVEPRPHYMCSVSAFNTAQKSDYYAFCRVNLMENKGWICGFYPTNKYLMDAKFYRKGEYDADNDYYVRSDCWSLPISKLQEAIQT